MKGLYSGLSVCLSAAIWAKNGKLQFKPGLFKIWPSLIHFLGPKWHFALRFVEAIPKRCDCNAKFCFECSSERFGLAAALVRVRHLLSELTFLVLEELRTPILPLESSS